MEEKFETLFAHQIIHKNIKVTDFQLINVVNRVFFTDSSIFNQMHVLVKILREARRHMSLSHQSAFLDLILKSISYVNEYLSIIVCLRPRGRGYHANLH